MDVDVEGTGNGSDDGNEMEPVNYGYGFSGPSFLEKESMARDAESDAIVRQLERGLPRWQGYGDKGWLEGASMVSFLCRLHSRALTPYQDHCAEIVHAIKAYKDVVSNIRIASVLDAIPEEAPIMNLSFNVSDNLVISLSSAELSGSATAVIEDH